MIRSYPNMTNDQKEWIDKSSYKELLYRWRWGQETDLLFRGDTGEYYVKIMNEKIHAHSADELLMISSEVGLPYSEC